MADHPIVHIEIPASNTKAASQFYADVFDWKITTDPTFDYHMFSAEGGPGGGFVGTGTSGGHYTYKPGQLLVYIGTDDIDASLASVEKHGGKVVLPKTEIPQMGWWAVFADPAGNHIGLFKALPRA
jgi:predicted enzyme related to lactoylglutathione lyase